MNVSRAGRAALLLIGSLVPALGSADFADAFPTPGEAARANERTVGVQLGRDARHFDLLDDVGRSLGLAAGLRIVPIVAANDVRAVYDLLYLDGADLAIVRSDSIEYVRREAGLRGARRLVHDVARVGNEKIVVVAHESVARLDELAGLPVAFGRPGSGEFVTGTLLFDALGIDVEKVEADGAEALARVRSGELAAMVHLFDAPDPFGHGSRGPVDGVRALALPRADELAALYHRTIVDATDLPGLVGPDRAVLAWSVDVNLVAYAWASGNERTRRVERFVEALVDRSEELRDDPSEPEWRDASLEADTPGLDGSPAVRRALERRAAALARLVDEARVVERIPETLARPSETELLMVRDEEVVDRLDGEAIEGLGTLPTPPARPRPVAPGSPDLDG